MSSTVSIHEFLERAHVPYSVVPHRAAHSAQGEAAAAHISSRHWAKAVVCVIDGATVEAIVPARTTVDLERLLDLAGGAHIRLAAPDELPALFPDCEVGALPPIGPIYGYQVFADVELALQPDIAFNAGSRTQAICLRWADFARSVRPIVGRIAS